MNLFSCALIEKPTDEGPDNADKARGIDDNDGGQSLRIVGLINDGYIPEEPKRAVPHDAVVQANGVKHTGKFVDAATVPN